MNTQEVAPIKGDAVNVLLVEDDVVDQQAIIRVFRDLKINNPLIVAQDGIDALDQMRAMNGGKLHRPLLIILDLNLPRMDGYEFLKKIRADDNLKDSIVFVLTTSRDEQDMVKSHNLNVAGYMVKGDLANSFVEAINMIEHYWRIIELPK